MPPRRINDNFDDSDSDISILDDVDIEARGKGKGKGKAVDRGQSAKSKGKTKEVRHLTCYLQILPTYARAASNLMHGRRHIRVHGTQSRKMKLVACKELSKT